MNLQTCRTCIMDTSDPGIRFDASGQCDYCVNFETNLRPHWRADLADPSRVQAVADQIRLERAGHDFDCIIGLSGGLDSSYTAFVAKEVMGLRPLLFHVDAGWNTDQAVGNIEKLVNGLGLDLYTEVVDWEEMKKQNPGVSRQIARKQAALDWRAEFFNDANATGFPHDSPMFAPSGNADSSSAL